MADEGRWELAEVQEATQVGSARRMAARQCELAELPETVAGHVSVVVVELASNLIKHAGRGELLMKVEGTGEDAVLDVVAIDRGPGMDLEQCFRDGFSTGGTPGTGLGAVRRAASLFDAYSDARGSVLFARFGTQAAPLRGSVARPLRDEPLSGDQWRFDALEDGWSLAVADGLGHGPCAHKAACAVIGAHRDAPGDPSRCLDLAHERSRGTRGSSCSVAVYRESAGQLLHAGIGNVATSVSTRDSSRGLASQNGTLGGNCPRVQQQALPIEPGSLLVMHTDGLTTRWALDSYPGLRVRHPQVIAGVLFRDAQRVRDDATVVVVQV